jgi:PAS domain S-box-containing protein
MRMGPPASVSFLLLGIGLVLTTFRARIGQRLAAGLGLVVAGIALLSITGYLYGARVLYTLPQLTGIALLTALVLMAVAVGLIASVTGHGLAAVLSRSDSGGVMARRLLVPLVLISLGLGWMVTVGTGIKLYDHEFGTALRTLLETGFFIALLWSAANALGRTEAMLRDSEAQQRILIQQIPGHAIFRTDLQGHPTTWNPGVLSVLGFEAHEFIGRDIKPLIFTPEDIADAIPSKELQEAATTGRANNDRWLRRKDGTRFYALGVTYAIRDADGRLTGYGKVMRDATDRQ